MKNPAASGLARLKASPWFRAIQAFWLLIVFLFLVYYMRNNWNRFSEISWTVRWEWMALAFLAAAARRLIGGIRWVAIVLYPNGHWSRKSVTDHLAVYFISGLSIYIPGNVWFLANRIYMSHGKGLTVLRSTFSLIYEMGMSAWTGIALGAWIGISLFIESKYTLGFLMSIFFVLSLLLFHKRCVNYLMKKLFKVLNRPFSEVDVTVSWVARLLILSFSIWIVGGISLMCVLKALTAQQEVTFFYLVSALALAWTVGFFTPWAPSGLGVQEGFLIWFLRDYSSPVPLAAAICLRLLYVFEDLIWGSLSLIFERIKNKKSFDPAEKISERKGGKYFAD